MRNLVYHVASTLDGFICHEDGSVNGFPEEGDHVSEYLHSLQSYDTVFMGRKTYEFGYDYGLQPGKLPYAHMKHYVFSKSIDINPDPGLNIIRTYKKEIITGLKAEEGTDIYLCGGGTLAGWCLENELIDSLILKLNPVMFGKGIPLFGPVKKHVKLELNGSKQYQNGVLLLTYRIKYK